jgi:PiT family inorganic phosphate transporter
MTIAILCLVALLAFANGSNDNGKGVATLVGFGAAGPMQALIYATIATAIGGVVSFFLAAGLLKGFSGNWLFSHGVDLDRAFYVAVLIGACGWVLLANKTGMPVSTTHAIIGALCGAGLVSFGNAKLQWSMLWQKFAVPLAVSPVLSLAIVYVLAWPVVFLASRVVGRSAAVVGEEPAAEMAANGDDGNGGGVATATVAKPQAATANVQAVSPTANAIHWLSCGLISFARGWNDTPKIAALSLLALSGVAHGTVIGFVLVTVSMAAGGLIMGRKVLDTLAKKLSPLPLAESLTASLVTACLVGLASWVALPVSTTHVATGSIIGAGLKNNPKGVKWAKVVEIVLSWIITLPVAAVIAAVATWVIR